jgi:hypothetical protein
MAGGFVPLQELPPQRCRPPADHDTGCDEFIRRFLLHVLPKGFHRIRHYGLLASSTRKASLARARQLLGVALPPDDVPEEILDARPPCPCCGGHMVVIETFERWQLSLAVQFSPQVGSPALSVQEMETKHESC